MPQKTILITGASGGLGAALARSHAAPGITLLLWGRDETRLAQAAAQCSALGATVRSEAFDLRDMTALIARLGAIGPVDIAIFNAGLGGTVPGDALAESPQAAQAMAEVNFLSPVVGASAMADAMARRGGGQIVLIGSIAESFALPTAPTYAGAKAGLAMFAQALSIRMARHRVAVTLVSPGFIDTPMSRQLAPPKPFLMTADNAARVITRGIARRKRRIVIPWQFAVIRAIASLLPRAVMRALLSRT